jgi:DNA-binding NarL/FixJ family response regulator
MLSMHSENTWVRQAIDAGAKGYILKSALDLELGRLPSAISPREKRYSIRKSSSRPC